MEKELRQLRPLFPESKVLLQQSGIGKVNAALQAAKMISVFHPDVVISTGCAGGNGDDINIQDVVVSTHLAYHDVYCGEAVGKTKEKRREIIGHFPEAKAVDMESAAIAQTCLIYKVPFISFRVISDMPLRDTDASQYHDFWNTIAEKSFHVTKSFVESL